MEHSTIRLLRRFVKVAQTFRSQRQGVTARRAANATLGISSIPEDCVSIVQLVNSMIYQDRALVLSAPPELMVIPLLPQDVPRVHQIHFQRQEAFRTMTAFAIRDFRG